MHTCRSIGPAATMLAPPAPASLAIPPSVASCPAGWLRALARISMDRRRRRLGWVHWARPVAPRARHDDEALVCFFQQLWLSTPGIGSDLLFSSSVQPSRYRSPQLVSVLGRLNNSRHPSTTLAVRQRRIVTGWGVMSHRYSSAFPYTRTRTAFSSVM